MHTQYRNVAIGIQQRLKSTRLPYKSLKTIGDCTITEHVVNAARSAAVYLNRHTHRTGMHVNVYLLLPIDDASEFKAKMQVPRFCKVITGDENDVLGRYNNLLSQEKPDYVVRVTGDCPLIPSPVIAKSITIAVKNDYDFLTNASHEFRTFYDGADCEVMSARALKWLDENAVDSDREHVTRLLYRQRPDWCSYGHLFSNMDLTSQKLSIDTEDDLMRARTQHESVNKKIKNWIKLHGRKSYHRY